MDRGGLWKSRSKDTGFLVKSYQDTPFYFDTDQSAAYLLWSRLYALAGARGILPRSVIFDVLHYPDRTGRRALEELIRMGLVLKVPTGFKNAWDIRVLASPSNEHMRRFNANPHNVWRSYIQKVTGESKDTVEAEETDDETADEEWPNLASQEGEEWPNLATNEGGRVAKFGQSLDKFGHSLYIKVKRRKDKGCAGFLNSSDLMTFNSFGDPGIPMDDLLAFTIFPGLQPEALDEARKLIGGMRSQAGTAMDLLRVAKMIDEDTIPPLSKVSPGGLAEALAFLTRDAREHTKILKDQTRHRYATAMHEAVLGLGHEDLCRLVQADEASVRTWWGVLQGKAEAGDMTLCGAPRPLVSMRLWTMSPDKAEQYLADNEDAIKAGLVGSKTMRGLAIMLPGYLEHLGLTAQELKDMAEGYAEELRGELDEAISLRWAPSVLQQQ